MIKVNKLIPEGASGKFGIMKFDISFDSASHLPVDTYTLNMTTFIIANGSIAKNIQTGIYYEYNNGKWNKTTNIPSNTDNNTITTSGIHTIANNDIGVNRINVDIPSAPEPTLIDKTITSNGIYNASDDDADGYKKVTIDVTPTKFYSSVKPQSLMIRNGISDTWIAKEWKGLTNFTGFAIWTDGDNIYFSSGTNHYVLDKSTSTWESKSWNGLTNFGGSHIWTDGDDIYCSLDSIQYVLDKSTSTWSTKTWSGSIPISATDIWTDGDNIYSSYETPHLGYTHYVLNKSTSTWETKTWTGLTSFVGNGIWTDGDDIYYSDGSKQYVLDKSTSTWNTKTWSGLTYIYGYKIWTDGNNVYYSYNKNQYILNKSTSTWSTKTWNGMTNFNADYVWTDGDNIYYSYGPVEYYIPVTKKSFTKTTLKSL